MASELCMSAGCTNAPMRAMLLCREHVNTTPDTCVHLAPGTGRVPNRACHSGLCPATDYPALYPCCGDDDDDDSDACPVCRVCGNDVAPPQSCTPGALCFDCEVLGDAYDSATRCQGYR